MKLISIIAGAALLISVAQSEQISQSEWALLLIVDSERLGIEMPEGGIDVDVGANAAKSLYVCMDVGYSYLAYGAVSDKRSDDDKKAIYEKFKQSFAYLVNKPTYEEFYSEKRLKEFESVLYDDCASRLGVSQDKLFVEVCVKATVRSEIKEFIETLNEYGNASLQYCSKYDQSK